MQWRQRGIIIFSSGGEKEPTGPFVRYDLFDGAG